LRIKRIETIFDRSQRLKIEKLERKLAKYKAMHKNTILSDINNPNLHRNMQASKKNRKRTMSLDNSNIPSRITTTSSIDNASDSTTNSISKTNIDFIETSNTEISTLNNNPIPIVTTPQPITQQEQLDGYEKKRRKKKQAPQPEDLPKEWKRERNPSDNRWVFRHIPSNYVIMRGRYMPRILEILGKSQKSVNRSAVERAGAKARTEDQMDFFLSRLNGHVPGKEKHHHINVIDDDDNAHDDSIFVESTSITANRKKNNNLSMIQSAPKKSLAFGWERKGSGTENDKYYFEHERSGVKIHKIQLIPRIFNLLRMDKYMSVSEAYLKAQGEVEEEEAFFKLNDEHIFHEKDQGNNSLVDKIDIIFVDDSSVSSMEATKKKRKRKKSTDKETRTKIKDSKSKKEKISRKDSKDNETVTKKEKDSKNKNKVTDKRLKNRKESKDNELPSDSNSNKSKQIPNTLPKLKNLGWKRKPNGLFIHASTGTKVHNVNELNKVLYLMDTTQISAPDALWKAKHEL